MKCTHCGAEIQDGAAFCPMCGQATSPAQTPPPAYPPQQAAYGSQQPGYPPRPPVYGYPQPVYVTPVPQVMPASPAEKEALFSTEGSVWMLIAAIVMTVTVLTNFIGNVLTLNIFNLLLVVCDILIAVGFWVAFASGRKQKMSSTGLSLIRVPYIIKFVFLVFGFSSDVLIWSFTMQFLSLAIGIVTFVLQCICFSSVKKSLEIGTDIAKDRSVAGRKAGVFAAVIMIVSASFTLIGDILDYLFAAALAELLADTPIAFLGSLVAAGGAMTVVVAVVAFLASISAALVLLKFAKKIRQANG